MNDPHWTQFLLVDFPVALHVCHAVVQDLLETVLTYQSQTSSIRLMSQFYETLSKLVRNTNETSLQYY